MAGQGAAEYHTRKKSQKQGKLIGTAIGSQTHGATDDEDFEPRDNARAVSTEGKADGTTRYSLNRLKSMKMPVPGFPLPPAPFNDTRTAWARKQGINDTRRGTSDDHKTKQKVIGFRDAFDNTRTLSVSSDNLDREQDQTVIFSPQPKQAFAVQQSSYDRDDGGQPFNEALLDIDLHGELQDIALRDSQTSLRDRRPVTAVKSYFQGEPQRTVDLQPQNRSSSAQVKSHRRQEHEVIMDDTRGIPDSFLEPPSTPIDPTVGATKENASFESGRESIQTIAVSKSGPSDGKFTGAQNIPMICDDNSSRPSALPSDEAGPVQDRGVDHEVGAQCLSSPVPFCPAGRSYPISTGHGDPQSMPDPSSNRSVVRTSSTRDRKRPLTRSGSLDYDAADFEGKSLADLQSETFLSDPNKPTYSRPRSKHDQPLPLPPTLETLGDLDQTSQIAFFGSQNDTDWSETGRWFVDRFARSLQSLQSVRAERRKLALEYEDKLRRRQANVDIAKKNVASQLEGLQDGGKQLVDGRKSIGTGRRAETPTKGVRS